MAAAGERERAAVRRGQALDLRIGGASYRQIAAALGVSVRQAYVDVWKELAANAKLNAGKAEHAKDIELQRIDRAVFGLWPAVQQGDPASVNSFTRLSDWRARLLGLDAPVKVAPTNPAGDAPYQPPAIQDAHRRFDEIMAGVFARLQAQPKRVGEGQTTAAAEADS